MQDGEGTEKQVPCTIIDSTWERILSAVLGAIFLCEQQ